MNDVEGIVLAAGESTRAGTFKMTLTIGEKTVVERSIEGMYEICSRIIVVGGHKIELLRKILANYQKVELILNENYAKGMFTSVKAGALNVRASRFFILPGDCPLVGRAVYEKMIATNAGIVIPSFEGRNGHPVMMQKSYIPALLNEPDESNLKSFIRRCGYKIVKVDDEGIIIDIDTIEDYYNIVKRYERNDFEIGQAG